MKAAVIIKGKLVFLEGTVDEVCQAVETLGLQEFTINFIQPLADPTSWESIRETIQGLIST